MLKKITLTFYLFFAVFSITFSQSSGLNCLISNGIIIQPSDTTICKNDSVFIRLLPNGFSFSDSTKFDWRDASGKQLGTQANLGIRTQVTLSIVCYVKEGQCKDTLKSKVVVKDKIFVPIIASSTVICEGDSVTLSTTYKAKSALEWTFPSGSGKECLNADCSKIKIIPKSSFKYSFTNQKTCHEGDSILIQVIPSPIFKGQREIVLCVGNLPDSIALNTNPENGIEYTWYPTGQPNNIISKLPSPKIKPNNSINYTVEQRRGSCLSKSDVKLIVGNQYIIKNLAQDTIICPDTKLTLDFYTNLPKNTYSYQWSPAGSGQNSSSNAVNVSPSVSTDYLLSVKYLPKIAAAGYYCEWFDTVSVEVRKLENLSIQTFPDAKEFPIGKKVALGVIPSSLKKYEWYINDNLLQDSTKSKIGVTLTANSEIKVRYKDEYGCYPTAIIQLSVKPNEEAIFPTIFNPEIEDAFRPFCKDEDVVKIEKLYIFNRWGQNVYQFEKENKNGVELKSFTGWDGKDKNGNSLASDVYIGNYRIRYGDGSFKDDKIEVTLVK